MPVFEYAAIDDRGKNTKGTIDAENIRAARQKLRTRGIFPTSIVEGGQSAKKESRDIKKYLGGNRISGDELTILTRQLATLLGAGLPLVGALQALSEQTDSAALRRITVDVREDVEEGSTLADSLGKFPKAFPRLYINMVTSGEASGTLDSVLLNLADYLESQLALRRKIRSALLYPILMLVICTLVIIGLLTFVVPKIVEIYKKNGGELPLPTKIMLFVSDSIVNYWFWMILAAVSLFSLCTWYIKQPTGQARFHWFLLRAPIFGSIYKKIATARFSRTLATLLSSGVGLLAALDIAKNIVGNVHVVKIIEDAKEGVREGRSLARELAKGGIFPSLLGHMIAVGEKSGELENMLSKASHSYENEVNSTLSGLTSLLEPLLMIIVGGIVLAIIISVLLPMANLIDLVQKG